MYWDPLRILEVAAAAMIFGAGIFLYRRKPQKNEEPADGGGGYGSQGGVLLFVIAILIAIHGLGGLEYRPSASELEAYQGLRDMRQ